MPVASSRNSQNVSEINSDCSPNENPNVIFKRRNVQKKDGTILVVNIQGLLLFNKAGVRKSIWPHCNFISCCFVCIFPEKITRNVTGCME